jgi:hypothetical protein
MILLSQCRTASIRSGRAGGLAGELGGFGALHVEIGFPVLGPQANATVILLVLISDPVFARAQVESEGPF